MFKRKLEFYSVGEKLPEEEGDVLTITDNDNYAMLNYSLKHKAFNAYSYSDDCKHKIDVKYWAYIPHPFVLTKGMCGDNKRGIYEHIRKKEVEDGHQMRKLWKMIEDECYKEDISSLLNRYDLTFDEWHDLKNVFETLMIGDWRD